MAVIIVKSATEEQKNKVALVAKTKGKTVTQFIKDWIDGLRVAK